jgi:citrate synthase
MSEVIRKGLEGIVVADSAICAIDGNKGTLHYRGMDIGDLALNSTYEETAYLLWHGELPDQDELSEFKRLMASSREIGDGPLELIKAFPGSPQPIESLRTLVSAAAFTDPRPGDDSRAANLGRAIRLTASVPTMVAYRYRHTLGKDIVHPDPELSHAANFLYMLRGEEPTPAEERAMDMSMILMADHEMNASTFSARVTVSTLSDMYSAVTSAVGTLKGPLHGGANQRAMEMFLEIGEVENVEPYICEALDAKRRIMGFGHRIYKTIDPRSLYLKDMVCELFDNCDDTRVRDVALEVARVVGERKPGLYPNVDFYAAPLLYKLGIPTNLFTSIFALSRVAGWTAHVIEQYEANRLLRPISRYVGYDERPYTPMELRNGHFPAATSGKGKDGR